MPYGWIGDAGEESSIYSSSTGTIGMLGSDVGCSMMLLPRRVVVGSAKSWVDGWCKWCTNRSTSIPRQFVTKCGLVLLSGTKCVWLLLGLFIRVVSVLCSSLVPINYCAASRVKPPFCKSLLQNCNPRQLAVRSGRFTVGVHPFVGRPPWRDHVCKSFQDDSLIMRIVSRLY